MAEETFGTTTVVQVGIVVRDVEKTAQNWARVFGLPVPQARLTDPQEKTQIAFRGQATPARAKLAFLRMENLTVELIEPVDGPSTWREHLDTHGEGVHHIAFQIQGMAEKLTFLANNGVPLIQRGEYTGGRYAYVDGTDRLGVILELLENDRK